MKLIDRDSLIDHMRKAYEGNTKNGFKWDLESAVVVICAEEEINQPIVRCKDCKYFMCGNGCILQAVDYSWEEQMYAGDFCSRGERKKPIEF